MGGECEQTFFKDDMQITKWYKKKSSTPSSHQGNATQNHNETSPHPLEWLLSSRIKIYNFQDLVTLMKSPIYMGMCLLPGTW